MSAWKRFNRVTAGVLLAISIATTSPAVGGGASGGALEITQLLNNGELIEVAISEAENLAYTIRQYQIMSENFKKLPDHIKQKALQDLLQLATIVATGRAVAYSSGQIDEDYQREHRDFEYYAQLQRSNNTHETYSERYREWAQSNHDSVRGALRAAGLQAQQFHSESAALAAIENQVGNAVGEMQVLQAGASIAALQVEQMQKLRQLVMAQMQMQAAHTGGMVERQAEEDAARQRATQPHNYNPNTMQPITGNDLF